MQTEISIIFLLLLTTAAKEAFLFSILKHSNLTQAYLQIKKKSVFLNDIKTLKCHPLKMSKIVLSASVLDNKNHTSFLNLCDKQYYPRNK